MSNMSEGFWFSNIGKENRDCEDDVGCICNIFFYKGKWVLGHGCLLIKVNKAIKKIYEREFAYTKHKTFPKDPRKIQCKCLHVWMTNTFRTWCLSPYTITFYSPFPSWSFTFLKAQASLLDKLFYFYPFLWPPSTCAIYIFYWILQYPSPHFQNTLVH